MSLAVYRLLHVSGALLLLFSLGALCVQAMSPRPADEEKPPHRGLLFGTHGVALLLLLVAGFGALAKRGMTGGIPAWVWPKLVLWLAIGALPALLKRQPQVAKPLFFVIPLLGIAAASLGILQPFSS